MAEPVVRRRGLRLGMALALVLLLLAADGAPAHRAVAEPDPGVPQSDPAGLIGMWRVQAPGADDRTWLRLAGDLRIWHECGWSTGSWRATSQLFLAQVWAVAGGCPGHPEPTPPWLERAHSYRPAGAGWELLDAGGTVIASLRALDAPPYAHPDAAESFVDVPQGEPGDRERLAPAAPLPTGRTPVTSAALAGRWSPVGVVPGGPHVVFDAAGTWHGTDGCNRSAGRWSAGPEGALLTTAGPTTLVGCPGPNVPAQVAGAARASIEQGRLSLFDTEGEVLAVLRRG